MMWILEVFIENGSAWPHNKDRVKYGPFATKEEAQIFFNRGSDEFFGPIEGPKFDKNHCIIQNVMALMNDPSEGIHWGYSC